MDVQEPPRARPHTVSGGWSRLPEEEPARSAPLGYEPRETTALSVSTILDVPPRENERSRDDIATVEVDIVDTSSSEDSASLAAAQMDSTPVRAASEPQATAQLTSNPDPLGSSASSGGPQPPAESLPIPPGETPMANNIKELLDELQSVDGFIAAAVADSDSGMALGTAGGGSDFNVDMAVAANTEVVKAKGRAMKALKLGDTIEDILITLSTQYHIIRPLKSRPSVFFYVALDRAKANLALARFSLADAENNIKLS